MRPICVATDVPVPGWTHSAQRVLSRLGCLRGRGGLLVAPSKNGDPLMIPGIRHLVPEIVPGASVETREAAVSDMVQEVVGTRDPALVHCIGIRAAIGALLGSRKSVPVVLEPGITPSQRLRDMEPEIHPAALVELVEIEDRVLQRAQAVIARSPLEAATLVKRGVASDRVWTAADGLPTALPSTALPELPLLATVVTGPHESDLSILASALERLDRSWRLTVFHDGETLSAHEMGPQFSRKTAPRVDFEQMKEGWFNRLQGAQIVIAAPRVGRALRSGALVPDAIFWGLAAGRPLVAPDAGSIRAYAGHAAGYCDADDPAALAAQLDSILGDRHEADAMRARTLEQAECVKWEHVEALIQDLWASLASEIDF